MARIDGNLIPHDEGTVRGKIYEIIFGHETREGKGFDVILLWAILLSIVVVMLESVRALEVRYSTAFLYVEWFLTFLFSIELIARMVSIKNPMAYLLSFWGIVDLLAVMPTYIGLFLPGTHYLLVIRILRLLRIFRILKLVRYIGEAEELLKALRASVYKITVFFGTVLTVVIITGTLMYLIEGGENGFESIPNAIYWAIITITTVGYGDIVPHTVIGKMLASLMMITGYSILAVPTGIVTVELGRVSKRLGKTCPTCSTKNTSDSNFCKICGDRLRNTPEASEQ